MKIFIAFILWLWGVLAVIEEVVQTKELLLSRIQALEGKQCPEVAEPEVISRSATVTVYHAVEGQTDSTPTITADGSKIDTVRAHRLRWCAISRDLQEKLNFGDTIYVYSKDLRITGGWVVKDLMHRRKKNQIDLLSHPTKGVYGRWENVTITK